VLIFLHPRDEKIIYVNIVAASAYADGIAMQIGRSSSPAMALP
jgi:hypothetical protein